MNFEMKDMRNTSYVIEIDILCNRSQRLPAHSLMLWVTLMDLKKLLCIISPRLSDP